MKKRMKRMLSFVLSIIMCLGCLPMDSFAAGVTTPESGPAIPREPMTFTFDLNEGSYGTLYLNESPVGSGNTGKYIWMFPGDKVEVIPQPLQKDCYVGLRFRIDGKDAVSAQGIFDVTTFAYAHNDDDLMNGFVITSFTNISGVPIYVRLGGGGGAFGESGEGTDRVVYHSANVEFHQGVNSVPVVTSFWKRSGYDFLNARVSEEDVIYYGESDIPTALYVQDALPTAEKLGDGVYQSLPVPTIEGGHFYQWKFPANNNKLITHLDSTDNKLSFKISGSYAGAENMDKLTASVELGCIFTPDKTITYDACGGTIDGLPGKVYEFAKLSNTPEKYQFDVYDKVPEKFGYLFSGWYTEPDGKGTKIETTSQMYREWNTLAVDEAKNIIRLYAFWEKEKYPISVSSNDETMGTVTADYERACEGTVVKLTKNVNLGYHFERWESGDVEIANDSFVMPEKPVSVSAIFASNTPEHVCEGTLIAREATCTEDGVRAHYECLTCGKWYEDAECFTEIKGEVRAEYAIPAAHVWESEYTIDKEPTFYEDGSKSIHCENCEETKDSILIDKLNHVEITLSHENMLLEVGSGRELDYWCYPESFEGEAIWSAVNEDEENPVISVDNAGYVRGLSEGSAQAVVSVSANDNVYSASCNVTVVACEEGETLKDEIENVYLPDAKATVELFKTDYTTFTVIPELEMMLNPVNSFDSLHFVDEWYISSPMNDGVAITGAWFTDTKVAALFDLKVLNDRTLAIVPNYDNAIINPEAVKSSYKSSVTVVIDGQEFVTKNDNGTEQLMTLTIKKSKPSIKASSIAFNGLSTTETKTINFTGGNITYIDYDTEAAAKAKKSVRPDWLIMQSWDYYRLKLASNPPAKASGKVYLLATVDGWAVKAPVTVSVSVTKTYPKIKFSPSSVTLNPQISDTKDIKYTVSPALFESEKPVITKIAEGKKTYTGTAMNDLLNISVQEGKINVTPVYRDAKAHTYKVYATLRDKSFSFTVKTLAASGKPQVTLKKSGTIDTGIPYSKVTVTATPKNFNADAADSYEVAVIKYKAKTKTAPAVEENVTHLFNIKKDDTKTTIYAEHPEKIEKGYTYYVYVTLSIGDYTAAPVKTSLTMKYTAVENVKPTLSLSAKGSIDVIRPDSAITITPKATNTYTYKPSVSQLHFYKTVKKVKTELAPDEIPFDVAVVNGKFVIKAKPDTALNYKTTKYSVTVSEVIDAKETSSKSVSLSIKQGSAKIKSDKSTLKLYVKDRYSNAEFTLTRSDKALSEIENVVIDSKNDAFFNLVNEGYGKYSISYDNSLVPKGFKKGTSKTVSVKVFLNGNETTSPNATIKIKVTIK